MTAGYRPLRPRGLALQAVLLLGVEAVLLASYLGQDAGFHWSTHFLVGLLVAAVWNLVWLLVAAAPARGQLAVIVAFHLFAMVPDLLFRAAVAPHEAWMDVFLGHISAHEIPGGDETWLILALVGSGVYAAVLAAWVRARRLEADAGMAPGVGIGGGGVVRPQHDPASTPLAHWLHGTRLPPDVLLLHGLAASARVWARVAPRLVEDGHAVLTCDLLGFGRSRRTGTRFGLDDQVDALLGLLDHHGAPRVLVVGHSWGCAVAARLAERAPARVSGLVLVSPPVFHDAAQARERLRLRGRLAGQVVDRSPVASITCGLMCLMRAPLARLAPRWAGDLPPEVVRDSFEHSWPAYRDALGSLFADNPLPGALAHPRVTTVVVVGEDDTEAPAADVLDHPHDRVEVRVVATDHLLPLRRPDAVHAAVGRLACSTSPRSSTLTEP